MVLGELSIGVHLANDRQFAGEVLRPVAAERPVVEFSVRHVVAPSGVGSRTRRRSSPAASSIRATAGWTPLQVTAHP